VREREREREKVINEYLAGISPTSVTQFINRVRSERIRLLVPRFARSSVSGLLSHISSHIYIYIYIYIYICVCVCVCLWTVVYVIIASVNIAFV